MAAQRPEHAHAIDRPATATFTPRPAHTTIGWRQDRRPVVSKRPLDSRAAAKMSPHICDVVLAAMFAVVLGSLLQLCGLCYAP
jgi:hypothetical protein